MVTKRVWLSVGIVFASACAQDGNEEDSLSEVEAAVGTTTVIPSTGECTHITATRLSDFHVSQYQGVLAGAKLKAVAGEHLVKAVAYPMPCNVKPAEPPWLADDQIATFGNGGNVLMLAFHANNNVTIEPTFPDDSPLAVAIEPGTRRRTGRNTEDAAGPHYMLDGWELRQIALPPVGGGGTPADTLVFTTQGKGGMTSSPRGVAAAGSTFVFQLFDSREPLRVFDAAGTFLESLPVFYAADKIAFDGTDGIEAIDATHFVRTAWHNNGVNCDDDGCQSAGIEILERKLAADNSPYLEVTQQFLLPQDPGVTLGEEYPVGVSPLPGGRFAVTTLPESSTRVVILDSAGVVTSTLAPVPGNLEGLFLAADGRLGAISYHGALEMRDASTGALRAGETYNYQIGAGFPIPRSLAWDSTGNRFIAASSDKRIVFANPSFTTTSDVALDLSAYQQVSSIEYRADTNQLLVIDRLPPIDPVTSTRMPTVDFYNLATLATTTSVKLAGLPLPVRSFNIAYVEPRQQIVSHHRKPGGVVDPVDTKVFIHHLDGSLAGSFDLAPFGFRRVVSVNYLAATDELLVGATDITGTVRLVVTTATGTPVRSYRTDAITGALDLAPVTSGAFAGQLGVVFPEPSEFARVTLP